MKVDDGFHSPLVTVKIRLPPELSQFTLTGDVLSSALFEATKILFG
jgi:hypothetical protein